MEIAVTTAELLPPGCIVSVRAGPTRRQAPLESLGSQPLKFPAANDCFAESLKIDVFQPVASARLVVQADCNTYRLALDRHGLPKGTALGLNISRRSGLAKQTGEAGVVSTPDVPVVAKHQDSATNAKDYLEKFNLLQFVQAMLHAVIAEKPQDPFLFMSEQLASAIRSPSAAPPSPPLASAGAPVLPGFGEDAQESKAAPAADSAILVPKPPESPPSRAPRRHIPSSVPATDASVVAPPSAAAEPEAEAEDADAVVCRLRAEMGIDEVGGVVKTLVSVIAGSQHERDSNLDLASVLGRVLAADLGPSVAFATGGLGLLQKTFAESFEGDAESRLFHLIGGAKASECGGFSRGKDLRSAASDAVHAAVRGGVGGIMITLAGGSGAVKETTLAEARGAKIIPLIRTGGASAGAHGMPPRLLLCPPWATEAQWSALSDTSISDAEYAAAVVALIKAADDNRPPPPPAPPVASPPPPSTLPQELLPASPEPPVQAMSPRPISSDGTAPPIPSPRAAPCPEAESSRQQFRRLLVGGASDGSLANAFAAVFGEGVNEVAEPAPSADVECPGIAQLREGLTVALNDGSLADAMATVFPEEVPAAAEPADAQPSHDSTNMDQLRKKLASAFEGAAETGELITLLRTADSAARDADDARGDLSAGETTDATPQPVASVSPGDAVSTGTYDLRQRLASALGDAAAKGELADLIRTAESVVCAAEVNPAPGDVEPSCKGEAGEEEEVEQLKSSLTQITGANDALQGKMDVVAGVLEELQTQNKQLQDIIAADKVDGAPGDAERSCEEEAEEEEDAEAVAVTEQEVEQLKSSLTSITCVSAELRGNVQALAGVLEELQTQNEQIKDIIGADWAPQLAPGSASPATEA